MEVLILGAAFAVMISLLAKFAERRRALETSPYVVSWGTLQGMLADVAALEIAGSRGIPLMRAGAKTSVIVSRRELAFELAKAGAARLKRSVRVTSLPSPEKVWRIHPDGRVEERGPEPGDFTPQQDTGELRPDDLIETAAKLLGEWTYVVDWNDPAVLSVGESIDRSKRRVFGTREEAKEFALHKASVVGYPVSILKVLVPRHGDALKDGLTREGWSVLPDGRIRTLTL